MESNNYWDLSEGPWAWIVNSPESEKVDWEAQTLSATFDWRTMLLRALDFLETEELPIRVYSNLETKNSPLYQLPDWKERAKSVVLLVLSILASPPT